MFFELLLSTFIVDISDLTLTFPDGTVIPVAVGKSTTKTPLGKFTVNRIVDKPNGTYTGFYGSIAVQIENQKGEIIGVHGTNNQFSIGNYVSGGCIRIPKEYESKLSQTISFSSTFIIQD